MMVNIIPEVLSCSVMAIVAFVLLSINDTIAVSFIWGAICAAFYFATLYLFPKDRLILLGLKDKALSIINRKKQ